MRLLDKGKDDIFINKFSAEATVFKAFASTAKSRYKTKKVDFQSLEETWKTDLAEFLKVSKWNFCLQSFKLIFGTMQTQ